MASLSLNVKGRIKFFIVLCFSSIEISVRMLTQRKSQVLWEYDFEQWDFDKDKAKVISCLASTSLYKVESIMILSQWRLSNDFSYVFFFKNLYVKYSVWTLKIQTN